VNLCKNKDGKSLDK